MTKSLFSTQIYKNSLKKRGTALNKQLLREIALLTQDDSAGREWSKQNYPMGYTSYASANQMHLHSPTFAQLEKLLQPHLKMYLKRLQFTQPWQNLKMSTCWVNVMKPGCTHPLHTHPHSIISGTYYVSLPDGASPLRLEDPRYPLFMNRPPVKTQSSHQSHVSIGAKASDFVFFESWLRHDVPINQQKKDRISISFNYE